MLNTIPMGAYYYYYYCYYNIIIVIVIVIITFIIRVVKMRRRPATGAIAGYSEVFAGCKLLEKREK